MEIKAQEIFFYLLEIAQICFAVVFVHPKSAHLLAAFGKFGVVPIEFVLFVVVVFAL
jgi:hypothetical protein